MAYKLGSLFDGSGGFPLAGALCGIEPIWAAEVRPYPIAVTRSRFPSMKHLGDISKVNGDDFEPYWENTGKPYKHKTPKALLTWYNKLWTDSAEYKMWGNGIALPTALYCLQGILDALVAETIRTHELTADLRKLTPKEEDAWMQ